MIIWTEKRIQEIVDERLNKISKNISVDLDGLEKKLLVMNQKFYEEMQKIQTKKEEQFQGLQDADFEKIRFEFDSMRQDLADRLSELSKDWSSRFKEVENTAKDDHYRIKNYKVLWEKHITQIMIEKFEEHRKFIDVDIRSISKRLQLQEKFIRKIQNQSLIVKTEKKVKKGIFDNKPTPISIKQELWANLPNIYDSDPNKNSLDKIGAIWINSHSNEIFMLESIENHEACWKNITKMRVYEGFAGREKC